MKKILILLMISLLVGCQTETTIVDPPNNEAVVVITEESIPETEERIHRFATTDEAVKILSFEDDYIKRLSLFDCASKFDSDVILDEAGRIVAYDKVVLEWNDEQKNNIDKAMLTVTSKLELLDMDVPEIVFGLTTNADEGGAAYTRGNMIVLKPYHVAVYSKGLEELIAHELFHVYSRLNKDKRPAIYDIIGYTKCDELSPPESLKDLMIANPDAPENNYYIEGTYQGVNYAYIPVIYSSESYEIGSGRSFFETLHDDMLAVELIGDEPVPVLINDELLIVKKDEIVGFYEQIGRNTDYTYHPEETMADNFVFLLFDTKVSTPRIVKELRDVLKSN